MPLSPPTSPTRRLRRFAGGAEGRSLRRSRGIGLRHVGYRCRAGARPAPRRPAPGRRRRRRDLGDGHRERSRPRRSRRPARRLGQQRRRLPGRLAARSLSPTGPHPHRGKPGSGRRRLRHSGPPVPARPPRPRPWSHRQRLVAPGPTGCPWRAGVRDREGRHRGPHPGLGRRLRPRGVRVNAVALGSIATERSDAHLRGLQPAEADHFADEIRLLQPLPTSAL